MSNCPKCGRPICGTVGARRFRDDFRDVSFKSSDTWHSFSPLSKEGEQTWLQVAKRNISSELVDWQRSLPNYVDHEAYWIMSRWRRPSDWVEEMSPYMDDPRGIMAEMFHLWYLGWDITRPRGNKWQKCPNNMPYWDPVACKCQTEILYYVLSDR